VSIPRDLENAEIGHFSLEPRDEESVGKWREIRDTLDHRKRSTGFWFGLLLTLYRPFRVWLDTLHSGVSPDTWFAIAATAAGAIALLYTRHKEPRPS
jgi:hypothetical protein